MSLGWSAGEGHLDRPRYWLVVRASTADTIHAKLTVELIRPSLQPTSGHKFDAPGAAMLETQWGPWCAGDGSIGDEPSESCINMTTVCCSAMPWVPRDTDQQASAESVQNIAHPSSRTSGAISARRLIFDQRTPLFAAQFETGQSLALGSRTLLADPAEFAQEAARRRGCC